MLGVCFNLFTLEGSISLWQSPCPSKHSALLILILMSYILTHAALQCLPSYIIAIIYCFLYCVCPNVIYAAVTLCAECFGPDCTKSKFNRTINCFSFSDHCEYTVCCNQSSCYTLGQYKYIHSTIYNLIS